MIRVTTPRGGEWRRVTTMKDDEWRRVMTILAFIKKASSRKIINNKIPGSSSN